MKDNWDDNRAKKASGGEVVEDDWVSTSHFGLNTLWSQHRDELAPWWGENGSSTYNDAAQRLAKAFANFHKGRAKFPCFKHKGHGGSVRFTNQAVRLTDSHHLRINRVDEVKTDESTRRLFRHLDRGTGMILAATLIGRSSTWTVSFSVEVARQVPVTREPERIIGVDVGITTLYTGATPEASTSSTSPTPTTS